MHGSYQGSLQWNYAGKVSLFDFVSPTDFNISFRLWRAPHKSKKYRSYHCIQISRSDDTNSQTPFTRERNYLDSKSIRIHKYLDTKTFSYEPDHAAQLAGITHLSGININLVSYACWKKLISLPWDRVLESTRASAFQQNRTHAPCRTFVPVNRSSSRENLRTYGKFSSHFTEIPPSSRWDLT